MLYIHSTQHPTIKSIVRLHDSKERKRKRLCIIEGTRALQTALEGGLILDRLYCVEKQLLEAYALTSPELITHVSEAAMEKMSTATTPSGLLGAFRIPHLLPFDSLTPGLVLAQISDPGNMGTLIRTAAACNIRSVVVIEGTDPWSPKVLQASAGACALVQIFQWSWSDLMEAKKELQLYGLVVEGGENPSAIDPERALLVVGNEARGIPPSWLTLCDSKITLPMPGNTESLNAAIAGSIALYYTFVKP